jgi:putative nucleotidyltransferase with HDIG domain
LHIIHLVLGGISLLPILAGAVWFGLRGGVLTALLVSGLYFVHMRLSWPNQPMENANQAAMIFVYLFVGIASGILVMLQERERQGRLTIEQTAQREAIVQGFTSLSTALGSRDGYTLEHSRNVAQLAVELGRRRGLSVERLEMLRLAALVHDIGKIGIRDDVLLKPDKLTVEETAHMHQHPAVAADILRGIRGTEAIAEIVLSHHEKLNGMGYPRGLRNGQIPLEAQVLSVADIFCALTEQRPYKPAIMDAAKALSIIEPMAGIELDQPTIGLLKGIVAVTPEQPAANHNEAQHD